MDKKLADKFIQALNKIDRPGTFCVHGNMPAVLPGLEVPALGPIGLPLGVAQAKELKQQCEQAPYGKGTETLVDKAVRNVWRLEPSQFTLMNPAWSEFIEQTVGKVQAELGLNEQKLEAHLYDLLLYEKGSFFLPHKDGEKLDRMVATLVIVLPSAHEGGELIVRHDGQEVVVDFASASSNPFEIHYAAFYADCEHEVRPLRQGHRLCLVYNLTLQKAKEAIQAPRAGEHIDEIGGLLRTWSGDDESRKLVILLEHQYTEKNLSWDTLKGVDRAVADILARAAESADCRAYLGLLTFWESGAADSNADDGYRGRGRYRDYDEEDEDEEDEADDDDGDIEGKYTMDEVIDSSLTAKHCTDRAGKPSPFEEINIDEEELLDAEALRNVKPEENFEGYTGNAGMTLARWYRHAAIILWPERRHFEVVCDQGTGSGVELLKTLVDQWSNAGKKNQAELYDACIRLARAVAGQWRSNEYGMGHLDKPKSDDFFPLLAALDDADLIDVYLSEVMLKDRGLEPGAALAQVCEKHGWQRFAPQLVAVFKAANARSLPRDVRVLEHLASAEPKKDEGWSRLCESLAELAVQAVIEADSDQSTPEWQRPRLEHRAVLPPLMRALIACHQETLLAKVVAHLLANPKKWSLESFHLPVLAEMKTWFGNKARRPSPALAQWIAKVREALQGLTAEMPRKPKDFRRPASATCKCANCNELNRFLADPAAGVHRFRVLQAARNHLQTTIANDHCDVDCQTDRKGSPHTLVCTKNTKSFEAALKKYHEDVKHLDKVREIESALPRGKNELLARRAK